MNVSRYLRRYLWMWVSTPVILHVCNAQKFDDADCSVWFRQEYLGQKPIVLRNLIRYNRSFLDTI